MCRSKVSELYGFERLFWERKIGQKMKIVVVLYFKGHHASYVIVLNKLGFKDLLKDSLYEFKDVFCGYIFWVFF